MSSAEPMHPRYLHGASKFPPSMGHFFLICLSLALKTALRPLPPPTLSRR